ncbi:hypothetical protein Q1695_016368 [Nippostrongylus brasiliensis]|nr:hypothetical protein Q1695_016368 [Nippostrongylus brasiliensis]
MNVLLCGATLLLIGSVSSAPVEECHRGIVDVYSARDHGPFREEIRRRLKLRVAENDRITAFIAEHNGQNAVYVRIEGIRYRPYQRRVSFYIKIGLNGDKDGPYTRITMNEFQKFLNCEYP